MNGRNACGYHLGITTGTDRALEYRYAYDAEAHRTVVTDSLGHDTVYQITEPFEPPASADTPLRFSGQYQDRETGWHDNLYRHNDPVTARFTSADPLGLAPAGNARAYVHNPTNWADPLGLARCTLPPHRAPTPVCPFWRIWESTSPARCDSPVPDGRVPRGARERVRKAERTETVMRIEDLFPLATRVRERAEVLRRTTDVTSYRQAARELVDLVFTEDTEYLDALPPTVETSLVPALESLDQVLEADPATVDPDVLENRLLVAAMSARQSVIGQSHLAPPELRALILRLPAGPAEAEEHSPSGEREGSVGWRCRRAAFARTADPPGRCPSAAARTFAGRSRNGGPAVRRREAPLRPCRGRPAPSGGSPPRCPRPRCGRGARGPSPD
ncbi:RHS repeat-associated core domain-containing protein [Streptomyces triticirhizae]|uniref:RHS repeat-associated core domain-containing protein n=1 Tax=Streptomyces triticirhizae TaxID=2483353 RepID=A0A3M2M549_9ACTN|nr:RHS repeat-associated core domain-containing protein [Streptomyces triticirhizae]RMI43595.1 RHS repeat-associated core domain-containing protein [Streptomyces triticirhizae]